MSYEKKCQEYTVVQLKELAKSKKIKNYSKLRKAELCQALDIDGQADRAKKQRVTSVKKLPKEKVVANQTPKVEKPRKSNTSKKREKPKSMKKQKSSAKRDTKDNKPLPRKDSSLNQNDILMYQTWIKSHPIDKITFPDDVEWVDMSTFRQPGRFQFPRSFSIHGSSYEMLDEIPRSHAKLNCGSMGCIAAYQNEKTNRIVAMKMSDSSVSSEIHAYEVMKYLIENGLMKSHSGPSCAAFLAHITGELMLPEKKIGMLVIEFMDLNVQEYVETFGASAFDLSTSRSVFRSIAEGISCLHNSRPQPLTHGDIKPANIMVSPYQQHWTFDDEKKEQLSYAKLIDFGSSIGTVWPTKAGKLDSPVMTAAFSSPQRFLLAKMSDDNKFHVATRPDDVWSFGVVMAFCLVGMHTRVAAIMNMMMQLEDEEVPTEKQLMRVIETAKKSDKVELEINLQNKWTNHKEMAQEQVIDLIMQTLEYNPLKRITIDQILKHPFFKG